MLLVESDPRTVEILADHICQAGDLTVISAESIADAYDLLGISPQREIGLLPDVVVIASSLSDGTALHFLHTVSRVEFDLPSIVLSSTALISPQQFIAAGAVAHFYKNPRGFDLHPTIRQILARRQPAQHPEVNTNQQR